MSDSSWNTVCTKESNWKPGSNTVEPDRQQHDRLAAGVIAQQYSSAAFVSLRIHSRKDRLGWPSQNKVLSPPPPLFFFSLLYNFMSLKCISWETALSRGVSVQSIYFSFLIRVILSDCSIASWFVFELRSLNKTVVSEYLLGPFLFLCPILGY